MKKTAIICEYNPFTNGHARHIAVAREETAADAIVCVMSGCFTQRGEAAVLDRYQRAEIAVQSGADLVIELPLVYAISPADNFAYGAIKTIAAIPDVSYVSFGSECGDIEILEKTAAFCETEPERFKELLREEQANGYSYPKAYAKAVDRFAEEDLSYSFLKNVFDYPNNALGVSYIRAAKKMGYAVSFHTVRREANENTDTIVGDYPPASAIRKSLREERFDEVQATVPDLCYRYLRSLRSDGSALKDLCLFKMRSVSGYDLVRCYDMDVAGGLHNRLKLAATEADTFDTFLDMVKSKNYTLARIKRICLYVLFDITQDMYDELVGHEPYLYVLAVRKSKKEIIPEMKNDGSNVLVRYSEISDMDKTIRKFVKLDFQAQGTWNLINRTQNNLRSALFLD